MTHPLCALALLTALAGPATHVYTRGAQPSRTACLRVEPDTVEVSGILGRETYPAPPDRESAARGGAPETGLYLHLERPACLATDLAARIGFVQLVLDSIGYAHLRPLLGARVVVRGVALTPSTGHHHAPLLLRVIPPSSNRQ